MLKIDKRETIVRLRPDASCATSEILSNGERKNKQIFIEIERNRNSIKTVINKFRRYSEIIPVISSDPDNAVIIFFFESSKDNRYFSEKKLNTLLKAVKELPCFFYIGEDKLSLTGDFVAEVTGRIVEQMPGAVE